MPATPRASGGSRVASCSVGFADPEAELVLAPVQNGMLEHDRHEVRMRAAVDAIYEDLGL